MAQPRVTPAASVRPPAPPRKPLAFRRRDRIDALLRTLDFDRTIAPDDEMREGDTESYFHWGAAAIDCIQTGLRVAEFEGDPATILDLPCGHGRVLRMLRAAYPQAKIHGCDIKEDGVRFCARRFGAAPVVSTGGPAEIKLPGRYDLIWVGSLLTHVDAANWHGFLKLFADHLKNSGVLVFTTLGRTFIRELQQGSRDIAMRDPDAVLRAYRADGFAYQDFSSTPGYGIAAVRPRWVAQTLESFPELELMAYTEGGWNGRQDSVVCRRAIRAPEPRPAQPAEAPAA